LSNCKEALKKINLLFKIAFINLKENSTIHKIGKVKKQLKLENKTSKSKQIRVLQKELKISPTLHSRYITKFDFLNKNNIKLKAFINLYNLLLFFVNGCQKATL
jgi:hypothetical protein